MADFRAAGVVFVSPAGRVLMLRRVDDGHYWAFPGGGIEAGETPEVAARREVAEETGYSYVDELKPWTHRDLDGVDFTTFLAAAPVEFEPLLNAEHDLARWVTPDEALAGGGLHPGAYIALLRFDMDELGIARAMRIGELTSPQRYQNLLLIALRITGTGVSYRTKLNEYVWRDQSLYLNDDMVQRCQGLPVVVDHPETDVLDTTEFHDRVIGNIFLPYIDGDEVWGIAKIYDDVAAKMLETLPLSTSPGVIVGGQRQRMADGSIILVESEPSLVDHLAICMMGVWDKGGSPAGVSNQSTAGDTTMPEPKKDDDKAVADGAKSGAQPGDGEGEPIDRVLEHLSSLHGKVDAINARVDSIEAENKKEEKKEAKQDDDDGAKKDDAAKKDDDKAAKDAEEQARVDAMSEEERTKYKADKAKKDAEEKAAKDAEELAKKDATMKDSNDIAKLNARLDSFEGRLKEPTPEERAAFVAAQSRAEGVFQAFGDASGAPRFLQGETLLAYRKRLLKPFTQHSRAWKDANLEAVHDDAILGNIETQVFADAMSVAMRPVTDSASPVLREIIRTDATGRQIKTFVGNPEACWAPFKHRGKLVTGINIKSER